jgi:signal transduction histidine kinase
MGTTQDSGGETPELNQLRHDLRQYVAAGMLLSHPSGEAPDDPAMRERLQRILEIFARMDELVRTPTASKAPDWVVDLVQLVDDCVSYTRLTHGVPLDLVGAEEPVEAIGDPVMLRRALINVLDNATRAAGKAGRVRVQVSSEAGEALVEVADDGDGFGRIPSVSGFGMSIVDEALRACRGRLEISSGPGPGTTVRMHIPAQRGRVGA